MQNLWNESEAKAYTSDLALRVYTSNLLGRSDSLVLHGGGNTSVKSTVNGEEILFVKGSGWDLVSIQAQGFAPVKMHTLLEMSKLKNLSDSQMVRGQKEAMIDPLAPNPSVEAILHAIIPFKVVDHTHADAVVTISNSKNGTKIIAELYPHFLIVPYVMPGFILAQKIVEMTQNDFDWAKCEGIILHNHGIFTFDNDAEKSYTKMIDAVTLAEDFLEKNAPIEIPLEAQKSPKYETQTLQNLLSKAKGYEVTLKLNTTPLAHYYASQKDLERFATRGVLTPEHIIRTKRIPLIIDGHAEEKDVNNYVNNYVNNFFETFATDEICLNPAPNYAVIKNVGIALFGKNEKEVEVMNDIIEHTMMAVLRADQLGGYQSISLSDSFDMEYWELEQAKLKG